MSKLIEEELIHKGIGNVLHEGRHYFSVVDVKQGYPDMKINTDNLKEIEGTKYVTIENIIPMTEFDKNLMKILKRK